VRQVPKRMIARGVEFSAKQNDDIFDTISLNFCRKIH